MLQADDTPTQPLDLRRDALGTAGNATLTILEQLCYLKDLAWTCRRFGYDLPYSIDELDAALSLLRNVAGRVRQELQGDEALAVGE